MSDTGSQIPWPIRSVLFACNCDVSFVVHCVCLLQKKRSSAPLFHRACKSLFSQRNRKASYGQGIFRRYTGAATWARLAVHDLCGSLKNCEARMTASFHECCRSSSINPLGHQLHKPVFLILKIFFYIFCPNLQDFIDDLPINLPWDVSFSVASFNLTLFMSHPIFSPPLPSPHVCNQLLHPIRLGTE